jgi:toluene monooxygenase system protein D
MSNMVGPVLRMSDDVEAIVAAIREDNADKDVEVVDRGAYVHVQAPDRLRLTLATTERHLGRDFEMRQLEPMLSAFSGRIRTGTDEVVWHYGRDVEALG